MRLIIVAILFLNFLMGGDIYHYLMPDDAKKLQERLANDIKNSKRSIEIAMFMITNKKLVNTIINRAKKGKIKIKIAYDYSYDLSYPKKSQVQRLAGYNNIKLFAIRGKKKKNGKYGILHSKLIIIDDKIVYLGSANITKSAYSVNYEILLRFNEQAINRMYRLYFDKIISNKLYY